MRNFSQRKFIILGIFILIFLILLFRLFSLQIVDSSYKISSENNSQRRIVQYPARGLIYDRNDKLLVCNQAAYDLMVIPKQIQNLDTLSFVNDMGIDTGDFNRRINKSIKFSKYRPSVFYKQMSKEQYATFQEHLYKYNGFYVQPRSLREYKNITAAHILGDVGEVNIEMIKADRYYAVGDYAGKSGVEKYFEENLRGKKGIKVFLVDVNNKIQGSYMEGKYDTLAAPGKDIKLTIDIDLQEYGEKLMENKIGSVVAIDPRSGEILSLISSPTFDPNLLVGRQRGYNYDSLLNHPEKPLFNRAVSATYPPGSIFKMVMAIIGLQNKVITKYSSFTCDKSIVGCHNHPPNSDLKHAIQYSCNPYFYIVGKKIIQSGADESVFKDSRIGLEKWEEQVLSLGFEHKFDIGIPSVKAGEIPGPDFYDNLYGKFSWAYSTIYSLSIGQGEVLVVPLQMANLAAIIANRGFYYLPHLISYVDGKPINAKYRQKHITPFDPINFDPIVEGMSAAVNDEFGTGRLAIINGIEVCGKTGTAQNPHGEDHSIFIAFAPKKQPKIAIAVYVENAGFGGVWAAPIASLMIEKYLNDSVTNTWSEERILKENFSNIE